MSTPPDTLSVSLLEKQLHETNERLEAMLSALPVGIVIVDYNTRKILDVNPQALAMFGCSLEHLIGKQCNRVICPSETGSCPILDKGQKMDRSEREIITTDGERIPVLKTALKTSIDSVEVLLECFIDIRDKKKAEAENLQREKLQAVIEMAGAVCHEFNQPLQVLAGYCDVLTHLPGVGPEAKEAVAAMAGEIRRMGELTKNLTNITEYRTKPYLKSKIIDIKSSSGQFPKEPEK